MLVSPGGGALEDQSPMFHDQYVALRINRLDYLQLESVEKALDRIQSGEYGVCLDCGDPISRARLTAIPWAIRCITCQERFARPNGANGRAAGNSSH
jgi:RNA polymerase-binding transcription factor DksA